MRPLAKLIHNASMSYLPTAFPAHYYGMPNGKIYLVFSRFYEVAFGNSGVEFVFAEHKDFAFDYENDTIVPLKRQQKLSPVFAEQVDSPNAKFNIFSIRRNLNSYGEAKVFLNHEAEKMTHYVYSVGKKHKTIPL